MQFALTKQHLVKKVHKLPLPAKKGSDRALQLMEEIRRQLKVTFITFAKRPTQIAEDQTLDDIRSTLPLDPILDPADNAEKEKLGYKEWLSARSMIRNKIHMHELWIVSVSGIRSIKK